MNEARPGTGVNAAGFQAELAQGNALLAAGQVRDALDAYRRAIGLAPDAGIGYYNLGIALRRAQEWREAVLAFRAAATRDARDFDAVQNVVTTLAGAAERDAPPLFPRERPNPAGDRAPVSIVVCSNEPRKLEAMRESFVAALGSRPHEFIVIADARSLAEGYTRGLAAAHHDIVVFSHDDVELLSPRPFDAIARAFETNDVVGIAGSRLVNGAAVLWAGHPHLHGHVAYPVAAGYSATTFSLEGGIIGGMQALDGALIAARREAALAIGFDADTFDGFHFYDLDFSYRAHLAGLKVAVTTEITALHESAGEFDDAWRRYARRFAEKFPALNAPAGPHHSYSGKLGSTAKVVRFYEELNGLAKIP